MPMRVEIDRDLCELHGVCAAQAPEVFRVGKDETTVLHEWVEGVHAAATEKAVLLCPRSALPMLAQEPRYSHFALRRPDELRIRVTR
jgi:ferredoxin